MNNSIQSYLIRSLFFGLFLISTSRIHAQSIPTNKVIAINNLDDHLKKEVRQSISNKKDLSNEELAEFFRGKFSERFFYDWKTTSKRFGLYDKIYGNEEGHNDRANDHMTKYADSTLWKLPFNYQNGDPVNAYALRHLARQHKMMDIAYMYFYDNKDPKYIQYFTRQMRSLNVALENGDYEKTEGGNGVYEAFRSGYRVLNWLSIHNMFLGEEAYTDEDQLTTIATLLQHGAHLYARNDKFKSGNHQTRGVSALAMLAILLRDFKDTDLWYDRAMLRLEEHLSKEINNDGFQFERSVHYHMSDIGNFFYVYQLAAISEIEISKVWTQKMKSLFTTLVRIAYPDRSAPVLQDDTEIPWAEKNDISGAMTLGYLLFEDETFGYFAENHVEDRMYWFLQQRQLDMLESIETKKPKYPSDAFIDTGYYIMREGWDKNDKMMIISAGLDDKKPDHQHGDMLGIQAMANDRVILPNYQVRYPLADFYFFKNSMVKNVALVDDELQGEDYKGNKGGSGFGKFGELPDPVVITWQTNDDFDLFVGSHNGFEDVGVEYTRQVIFVKDDFWIVKDNFNSNSIHEYKQVWQGHYSFENAPNILRSTFDQGEGCDIFQLNAVEQFKSDGKRGKEWSVVSKTGQNKFSFITAIYPYLSYSKRLDESNDSPKMGSWEIDDVPFEVVGESIKTLTNSGQSFVFGLDKMTIRNTTLEFSKTSDVFVEVIDKKVLIQNIADEEIVVLIKGVEKIELNDKESESNLKMLPGQSLKFEID